MKKITFIFLIISLSSVHAQLIDVLQGHIGTAIFQGSERPNFQTGKPENIYGEFAPAQIVGFGGTKFLTDKFQLNVQLEFLNTFKPNYNMVSQKTGANIKYNFIAPDIYRFSPYIFVGGSYSFILLSQRNFIRKYTPPAEYSKGGVAIDEITYRENEYDFLAPVLGIQGGAGLDINVFEVVSVFGEYTYNYQYTTRSGLQNQFTSYNKSNLEYYQICFGVRLYMY
jgi:hypothetical protein